MSSFQGVSSRGVSLYNYEVYVNSYFDTAAVVIVNIHVVVVGVVSIVVAVVACIDTGM